MKLGSIRLTARRVSALFFAAVIASSLLLLPGCSASYIGDSKQVLNRYSFDTVLKSDGSMNVTETWVLNLEERDKAYRNVYKTFVMDSAEYAGVEIADLSVFDVDNNVAYTEQKGINPNSTNTGVQNKYYTYSYTADDGHKMLEIGCYMPPIDSGVRTFKFSYTIKNLAQVYNDTAALYWQAIGNQFSIPITQMDGTITLPNGTNKDALRAWLHCTAKSNLVIESGNKITFTAENVPAETMVETRITLPASLFTASAPHKSGNVLPSIQAEEQKWADDWAAKQRQQYIIGIADAIGGILIIALGIVLIIVNRRKRRPHPVEVPEYTRDIPQDATPGSMAYLYYYYQGGVTDSIKGRIYSATLLNLARKGYVSLSPEGEDFRVTMAAGGQKELTHSESIFLALLNSVAEPTRGSFTMKDFDRYTETQYKYVNEKFADFFAEAEAENTGRDYFEKAPGSFALAKLLGLLFIGIPLAMFFGTKISLFYLPVGAIISGLLLLFFSPLKARLSEAGERDYRTWVGLKKFLLEFSRMTEYGVPQLELWDEYLVYATVLGVSKEVIAQLKVVFPQINDPQYMGTYFGNSYLFWMLAGPHGYHHAMPDFGATMASRFNSISAAANRLSNPPPQGGSGGFGGGGFGGGGFGGGGGGFGGGGGGVR